MKILLINNQEIKGGSAVVAKSLMLKLKKLGHEVNFLVAHKDSNNPNVFNIPTSRFKKALSYLLSNDIDFYNTDYILNLEVFKQADIINLHNLSGHYFNLNTLKKISKLKPVLWTFHDAYPINHYYAHSFEKEARGGLFSGQGFGLLAKVLWRREKYLKKKKKFIYKNSDFCISAPSQWLINRIKKTVLKDKKIYLIHNGVGLNFLKDIDKMGARKILGIPLDKKIILFISHGGKSNRLKGWSYFSGLIGSFNNRGDVAFLVIGGPRAKSSKYIKYISYVHSKKDLALYYAAADILLLPSIAENFPLAVLESMAIGTPVLSFNVGGISEVLSHKENGYLARYRDSEDLLVGLEYLLNLSDKKKRDMSFASKRKIRERFSLDKMTENYLKAYKKVISDYENRH